MTLATVTSRIYAFPDVMSLKSITNKNTLLFITGLIFDNFFNELLR